MVLDRDSINDCVKQFDLDASRLAQLHEYYTGRSAITKRARTTGLPNNRLMHGYPAYIATMTSGYLIGDPVQMAWTMAGTGADAYRTLIMRLMGQH